MKSVGERIRQAREARELSGEALAKMVGYKHQSAIGNLENRPGGTGGNKISEIAEALNVPLDWLIRGPDGEDVPTVRQKRPLDAARPPRAKEGGDAEGASLTYVNRDAMRLLNRLSDTGKRQAMVYLQFLVAQESTSSQPVSGEDHSLSHRAA